MAMRPRSSRIRGKWLVAARLAWLLLFLLSITKQTIGLPLYFEELSYVCADAVEAACAEGNALSETQVEQLQSAGISIGSYAIAALIWRIFTSLVWTGIGIFVFLLRPDDLIAWIASVMMILFSSGGYESQIAYVYPGLADAANLSFTVGNLFLFMFIALFPDGRFSPPWSRWYWFLLGFLGMLVDFSSLEAVQPAFSIAFITVFWLSFLIFGSMTQVHKYRVKSGSIERQQTKWVVAGFAGMATFVVAYFMAALMFGQDGIVTLVGRQVFDLAALMLPLSIGISILRYRLWDVDVIIRRTLQYALLTALLGFIYFGGVILLQNIFGSLTGEQNSPLITVISTLGIAALFNPLRIRTQEWIDRRFFRSKFDAETALSRFARDARDEVDLNLLAKSILDVVESTLHPERATLQLRVGPHDWLDADVSQRYS